MWENIFLTNIILYKNKNSQENRKNFKFKSKETQKNVKIISNLSEAKD